MADVEWLGLNTLQGYIKDGSERAAEAIRNEMTSVVATIFEESQHQVPVRYGYLKGSGVNEKDGENGRVIGYGGPAAGYALHVHEDLSAHHKPPTKAKFLEDPVNKYIGELEGKVADVVEGAIVGQLPNAPTRAAQEGVVATQKRAYAPAKKASLPRGPIRSMTADDIHQALITIDQGRKQRRTKGSTDAPTFIRKGK